MLYVFDSSTWIKVNRETPPDIYKSVWTRIDDAIEHSLIRSPDEVCVELEQGVDGLAKFLKSRNGLFVPLEDELQIALSEVMAECPTLSDPDSPRNNADPFVVALAKIRNATVVSQEKSRKDKKNGRMKIPDACARFKCEHLDWFTYLRAQGWSL